MSPTRDEYLLYLNTEIQRRHLTLGRWADTSMPAYRRAIEEKQRLVAERDRLLRLPPESGPIEEILRRGKPENERESVVFRILDKKGWSILDWANESNVDLHTANNYLKGRTQPYRSTRKKLAESLGLSVDELPR